jgi:hypothetical protein
VPANVTAKQLEEMIAKAQAEGKSQAHIKALQGQLKVLKRNIKYRGGCVDVRMLSAKVGVILMLAEVTSIVNHGFDELRLEQIGSETHPDGSISTTYFVTKWERTGFLGTGPLRQTGSLIYVLSVPKERVLRDGPPLEQMTFKAYNQDAFSQLLRQMGITEEWLQLPDDIRCVDDLFVPEYDPPVETQLQWQIHYDSQGLPYFR